MSDMMSRIRNLHYLKSFGYEFVSKELNFTSKESDFAHLRASVSRCELCSLSKKRHHSLIEPHLKPAKLMILDTFADKSEDESGSLLLSNKGEKLLNLLKTALNLSQDEIFLSYVYKCFSGGKNDASALSSCLPYFWSEFCLIKPRVLLVLGEDSFENLGFDDFKKLRGELFTHLKAWVMPTFSVEFIIKNPSFELEFLNDLSKIKGLL